LPENAEGVRYLQPRVDVRERGYPGYELKRAIATLKGLPKIGALVQLFMNRKQGNCFATLSGLGMLFVDYPG
jgi:hypothetical protein